MRASTQLRQRTEQHRARPDRRGPVPSAPAPPVGLPAGTLERMAVTRPAATQAPVQRSAAGGLPANLRAGLESLSGFDLSDVRVHRNSREPQALQAHAFAQGTDIHLAPGQERHLPHEAWHVVQQRQGRVRATRQLARVGVNDDPHLEAEADRMGARAMQMPPRSAHLDLQTGSLGGQGIAQRLVVRKDRVFSTFEPDVMINDKQAVITAASDDSATGGHSTVFLEYQGPDGLAHTALIDLITYPKNDWRLEIRIRELQVEVAPWTGMLGALASATTGNERSISGRALHAPGKSASHIITGKAAMGALARATRLQGSINDQYYYSTTGYWLPSHGMEARTPINCTSFASLLLGVAAVHKSRVVPSHLADDQSDKTETDARFKL